MASRLNPYISFNGDARQAMEFYQTVFGGTLDVNTFADFGQPDAPDGIMHSQLESDNGFTLMASDTPEGMVLLVSSMDERVSAMQQHIAAVREQMRAHAERIREQAVELAAVRANS